MSAKEPALSERMKHVLMLVSSHKAVADIGCDHGYMAIELIRSGKVGRVIAMDIHEGPLARARANLTAYGLCDEIETRRSDGMEALCRGEVQGVICAGMGGKTICGIMDRSRPLVRELDELVLQPQSELHIVRGYLRENGFLIAAEDMVSEDGKFYPMMRVIPVYDTKPGAEMAGDIGTGTACKECTEKRSEILDVKGLCGVEKKVPGSMETEDAGACAQIQRVEDKYGPCLLAEGHPVLRQYLQKERAVCEEVLRNLSQTDTERGLSRREELAQRLSDITIAEKICAQHLS